VKKKSKNNLVCQYLENISRKALEKYQNIVKKYVKGRHGLYVLYRKNKLYYVGLASNLRNRLKHHLRDRHAGAWDSFSVYLTAGGQHLKELETLLLRIIDRRGNKQRGKFGKAEDLRSRLKNDFKKAMNLELNEIFGGRIQTEEPNKEGLKKKKGRIPALATFVNQRFHIKFKYKGKIYIAHVRRNGTISFANDSAEYERLKGKIFTSPSKAASVATGKSMNGWTTWKYERAPGDWVLLDEIRK
jgi:hypothetical protein